MSGTVPSIYRYVIEDVIKNVKAEFLNEGLDESILHGLQRLWEQKLVASGAISGRSFSNDTGPYDMMSPPGAPLYSGAPEDLFGCAGVAHTQGRVGVGAGAGTGAGRARIDSSIDSRVSHLASQGVPPHIPQHDGTSDGRPTPGNDSGEQGYGAGGTQGAPTSAEKEEAEEAEEDRLGSDLDEEDEREPETDHLVLAQFEKVQRIKNKWKCNLKDGIMHLNGRDYLFHKCNGDYEW